MASFYKRARTQKTAQPVRGGQLQGIDYASSLPVSILYAWRYLAIVLSTISCGSVQSFPGWEVSQSRANCLSKDGCPCPGSYPSAGQKRELSGVNISSPSTTLPSSSRPNSNLVSAMMIPLLSAYSAHFLYNAMVLSRSFSASSRPLPGNYFSRWSMLCSKEIFSSWSPISALVDGV